MHLLISCDILVCVLRCLTFFSPYESAYFSMVCRMQRGRTALRMHEICSEFTSSRGHVLWNRASLKWPATFIWNIFRLDRTSRGLGEWRNCPEINRNVVYLPLFSNTLFIIILLFHVVINFCSWLISYGTTTQIKPFIIQCHTHWRIICDYTLLNKCLKISLPSRVM
jgi:hypothetical protein